MGSIFKINTFLLFLSKTSQAMITFVFISKKYTLCINMFNLIKNFSEFSLVLEQ